MPGFDGTGPRGRGSMTGRGMGPCGRGRGFRRGFGRGFGRRFWNDDVPFRPLNLSKDEQKKILEEEKKLIESDLEEIKKRLSELE